MDINAMEKLNTTKVALSQVYLLWKQLRVFYINLLQA
jgi:hypothetical protein